MVFGHARRRVRGRRPALPEPAALYRRLLASLETEHCPLCALLRSADAGPEVVAAAATEPQAACAPHHVRLAGAAPTSPALLELHRDRLAAWRTWLAAVREAREQPWRRLANLLNLTRTRAGQLPAGEPRARVAAARRCPACRWLAALDRAAGRLLLDHLDDHPVRDRFTAGRGLCAPHLEQLRTAAPLHRHLGQLLAYQASAVGVLETARRTKPDDAAAALRVAAALDGPAAAADAPAAIDLLARLEAVDRPDGDSTGGGPQPEPRSGQPGPAGRGDERGRDDPAALRLALARALARLDDVEKKWQADRGELAATRYRLWEVSEAKKRLELNLAGAEGEIALLSGLLDRRRRDTPAAADSARAAAPAEPAVPAEPAAPAEPGADGRPRSGGRGVRADPDGT